MAAGMSATEVRPTGPAMDRLAANWTIFLVSGLLSLLFGFLILSFKFATLVALDLFICAYLLAFGVLQVVTAFGDLADRWVYGLAGLIAVGAGIAGLVWPGITLLVLSVLIGWTLLFWGIADLIHGLSNRQMGHWWVFLIRGIVSLLLGIWALRHPGDALLVFVAVIGIFSVVFGVIEVIAAFQLRHAGKKAARAGA